MGPALAVEGATTRTVFEAYVEKALVPSLRPGQVMVIDNLSAHKGERVGELMEERGCEPVHLSPYSSDFKPIEQAFSKVKAIVCRAEGRTLEALVEAMGAALSAVSAQDAAGFFRHCGYRTAAQLL
jgi:transposase